MAKPPRLFLITPLLSDAAAFVPLLEAALDAADVACVLMRTAAGSERGMKDVAAALIPLAQRAGAAALIEGEGRLAARLGADGVHVVGDNDAVQEALTALKPDRIVGVGGIIGRDAAMTAGEAGVDYLMFGDPARPAAHAQTCEQIEWWTEIFNVPCVGYAERPALAGEIAAAGAEFIALCDGLWDRPDAVSATLTDVAKTISAVIEPVR